MKLKVIVAIVLMVFVFTGCSTMGKRAKCACIGAATGAAIGATTGAVIGNMGTTYDNRLGGGIIGGAAGAVIGGITGYIVCKEPIKGVSKLTIVTEPVCDKIVINSIRFDSNKSAVKPEYYPVLDAAISELKKCPNVKTISVEGNTDHWGTDEYNMQLGEKRATAVKDYIVKKGFNGKNITVKSFGEKNPIADDNKKGGSAINRRVEIKEIR